MVDVLREEVYNAIRNTIDKMMHDRGFHKEEEDSNVYKSDTTGELVVCIAVKPDAGSPNAKVGIEIFKQIVLDMEKRDIHHAVIVTYTGMTSHVSETIRNMMNRNYIELFLFYEMMSSPVEHQSQPRFTKLSKEQRQEFIDIYNIQNDIYEVPRMPITDRVARHYDYKRGDIIVIERLQENSVYYRIVA